MKIHIGFEGKAFAAVFENDEKLKLFKDVINSMEPRNGQKRILAFSENVPIKEVNAWLDEIELEAGNTIERETNTTDTL